MVMSILEEAKTDEELFEGSKSAVISCVIAFLFMRLRQTSVTVF